MQKHSLKGIPVWWVGLSKLSWSLTGGRRTEINHSFGRCPSWLFKYFNKCSAWEPMSLKKICIITKIETSNTEFHQEVNGKMISIILIKFLPACLQATDYDSLMHKVMMGTFSRDNFYGNHKLLHHKQQQQQHQTQASSLEMVRCTSPAAAQHHGCCGVGWRGMMHLQHQNLIYSIQTESGDRMKHRSEWWVEVQWSNKGQ